VLGRTSALDWNWNSFFIVLFDRVKHGKVKRRTTAEQPVVVVAAVVAAVVTEL